MITQKQKARILKNLSLKRNFMYCKHDSQKPCPECMKRIKETFDIYGNISGIRGNASEIEGDVSNIKGDVSRIEGDVSNIKGNVSNISGDVSNIRGDVSGIRGEVEEVWGDVSNIRGYVSLISGDVSHIKGDVSGITGNVSNIIGDVSGISASAAEIREVLNEELKKKLIKKLTAGIQHSKKLNENKKAKAFLLEHLDEIVDQAITTGGHLTLNDLFIIAMNASAKKVV
ncbi:MAG: hypothetical protein QW478_03085 [Candidatus Micrarchaeaceae archaeon]